MVSLTVEKSAVPAPERGGAGLRNLGLGIVAAVLQIVATVEVLQALTPTVAGIYFKGFVIAYGLAALLRGKYDLFVTQHFADLHEFTVADRELVRGLGIRVLVRSAIACAVLLVVTADLDVMDVYLRPYLQTYLPFVLAVPFATLALYLSTVLRAVNRTLSSTLVATCGTNIMILAVANTFAGTEDSLLMVLSWAFAAGTLLAAGVGVLITRNIFPANSSTIAPTSEVGPIPPPPLIWPEIYAACSRNGLTGLALACLQWGPACLLAILGSEIQLADLAAVTRTVQVINFLIPAAVFVPQGALLHSKLAHAMRTQQTKLLVDLLVSFAATTLMVAAVAITTPRVLEFYGVGYSKLTALFLWLVGAQWLNGTGRPAIRYLAAHWNLSLVRRILCVSAAGTILSSVTGIPTFGAIGAACSTLVGALLMNGQALNAAVAGCRARTRAHHT